MREVASEGARDQKGTREDTAHCSHYVDNDRLLDEQQEWALRVEEQDREPIQALVVQLTQPLAGTCRSVSRSVTPGAALQQQQGVL